MAASAKICNHVSFGFTWINTAIQGLFFFFLVVQETASLPHGRSAPLPDDHYYMNKGVRCLRCPPGTYVFEPCTKEDTRGICYHCHYGLTYSEGLTGQDHCHDCTRCRDDQVEVSPCTLTKNTVCRCKEGTYCRPDHPCEVCESCTPSCPPGEVLHQPCNSTTDSQCGPPTDHPVF
ncbi:tumor necrosis factor receptor superfamily member 26-like [Rhinophrynus dorsalis]